MLKKMYFKLSLLDLLYLSSFIIASLGLNHRPIIGVISVPSQFPDKFSPNKYSTLDGSIVSFVEAGGARVAPIPWNLVENKLYKLLDSLNGVVVNGDNTQIFQTIAGERKLTDFSIQIGKILNYTIEKNKKGIYFPLIGINSGFAALSALISEDLALFDQIDYDPTNPKFSRLNFKDYKSKVFQFFDTPLYTQLEKNAVVNFKNIYSIKSSNFQKNKQLNDFFKVVSTSFRLIVIEEVAVAEAKNFPIFIIQFSPHMGNRFSNLNLSYQSRISYSLLANFVVNESKKNSQTFGDKTKEDESLIYHKQAVFINEFFPRVYYFE